MQLTTLKLVLVMVLFCAPLKVTAQSQPPRPLLQPEPSAGKSASKEEPLKGLWLL